jgi:hypothetical protein
VQDAKFAKEWMGWSNIFDVSKLGVGASAWKRKIEIGNWKIENGKANCGNWRRVRVDAGADKLRGG